VPGGGYSLTGSLASVTRFTSLPGGLLEVPWTAESAEALAVFEASAGRVAAVERWFGSRIVLTSFIAATLVAAIACLFGLGLPRMARRIAFLVPQVIETAAGAASKKALLKFTALAQGNGVMDWSQNRVKAQLDRLTLGRSFHVRPSLVFVAMPQANAFALPGGTIVVTEGLLNMNLTDDETAAVLAHELGHEELRHGLQSVLRNSSALIVVSLITGDLSTLTTFSGTLPVVLLTRGYSRDFEREADKYAVDLLNAAGIDPQSLADALEKLDRRNGGQKAVQLSYLSTHPNTEERIRLIRSRMDAVTTAADYPKLIQKALEERNDHRYFKATADFRRAFRSGAAAPSDLYDAARSASRALDPDDAFAWLNLALKNGLKHSKTLSAEADFMNLRSDKRWSGLAAAWDASVKP
jgi:Zn-dependent protease with chaperone function